MTLTILPVGTANILLLERAVALATNIRTSHERPHFWWELGALAG